MSLKRRKKKKIVKFNCFFFFEKQKIENKNIIKNCLIYLYKNINLLVNKYKKKKVKNFDFLVYLNMFKSKISLGLIAVDLSQFKMSIYL